MTFGKVAASPSNSVEAKSLFKGSMLILPFFERSIPMKKSAFSIILFLLITYPCVAVETVGKPSSVELTVYNQNFALVKEVRHMSLEKGINFVSVPDVAAMIQPETVAFKSLTIRNRWLFGSRTIVMT